MFWPAAKRNEKRQKPQQKARGENRRHREREWRVENGELRQKRRRQDIV